MAPTKDDTVVNLEMGTPWCLPQEKEIYEVELIGDGNEAEETTKRWVDCEKNPGHPTFIPFKEFRLDHLPEGCRNNQIFKAIELTADLTVKLRLPGGRRGTGRIVDVLPGVGPHPKDGLNPSLKWYRVHVMTAQHVVSDSQHVVFDSKKARSTKVDLYYDDEESMRQGRVKTYRGVSILDIDFSVDWSILEFELCDLDIADKIKADLDSLAEVINELSNMPTDLERYNTVVIASHPHGQPKMVTVGNLKRMDVFPSIFYINNYTPWVYGKIEYDADTCHGCSGALLLWLGFSPSRWPRGTVSQAAQSYMDTPEKLPSQRSTKRTYDHLWELVHCQSVMFENKTSLFFSNTVVWIYLWMSLHTMITMSFRYGTDWPLALLLHLQHEILAPLYPVIYMISASIFSYLLGYGAIGFILQTSASSAKCCAKLITRRQPVPKHSEQRVRGILFWFGCIMTGLLGLSILYLLQDLDRNGFGASFHAKLHLFHLTGISVGQGVNDKLCNLTKMEKLPAGSSMKCLSLPLYFLSLGWFAFLALSTSLIILIDLVFWPQEATLVIPILVACQLNTCLFFVKSQWFKTIKAFFRPSPSRILSFVHSRRGNKMGHNQSLSGIWFQNSPTERDLNRQFISSLWSNKLSNRKTQ